MSLKYENEIGYFVSTEEYFNSIWKTKEGCFSINANLFKIFSPYSKKNILKKKKKICSKDEKVSVEGDYDDGDVVVQEVKKKYSKIINSLKSEGFLSEESGKMLNTIALETAERIYSESGQNIVKDAFGSNVGSTILQVIQDSRFLFPENSIFYSKDISEIYLYLSERKFDLILLDPPWWNKYIRRKRKKSSNSYNMLYNADLETIPIEKMLTTDGIVIVWCTNSSQHLKDLTENIFLKWGVKFVAKWYWLKVTTSGEPICEFSTPPGKQPFEQIIFGYKNPNKYPLPGSGKLIVSVPNAIHSSKPPLVEVIRQLLPENPQCLEIFARYLLPNWTSYGNEVLRFQHECLYLPQ